MTEMFHKIDGSPRGFVAPGQPRPKATSAANPTPQDKDDSDARAKEIVGQAREIVSLCTGKEGTVPSGWAADWEANVARMRRLILAYQAFDEAVPARISAAIIAEMEQFNLDIMMGVSEKATRASFAKGLTHAEFNARRGCDGTI